MKIKEALNYVDEICENIFSQETKIKWLNQVEAEIQAEVLLLALDGVVRYTADDLETELIAPAPFDKLYEEYLIWRIMLAQGEAERANNQQAVYEAAYLAYVRYVAENINPADGYAQAVRYYLSAYQIAVKNGYQGTETEWINSLRGPKGEPGAGLQIKGQVEKEAYLPKLDLVPGMAYLVGSGENALLYIWDGEDWIYRQPLSRKGDPGEDGREVQLHTEGGYICWRYTGETEWKRLVPLSSLQGPAGREVQIQAADGNIQWRYTNEAIWTNLIALSDLKGEKGEAGVYYGTQEPTGEDKPVWIDPAGTGGLEMEQVEQAIEDAYAYAKRTPYVSGKFGIGVWPAHEGYVPPYKYYTLGEIIKKSSPAVTPEEELSGLSCGFYTLYMHPNCADSPHHNSSFRGFCNLTNNGTDPSHPEQTEPYGYAALVDESGTLYLRYIAGLDYDSGWNKALMENDLPTIVQEVIKALPVYDGGVV